MNDKIKNLLIYGEVMASFTMTLSSPLIHLYFMKLVPSVVYTASNLITLIVAAIVQTLLKDHSRREVFKKFFMVVVVVDIVAFIGISTLGVSHVSVRFLGLALLNSITTGIWSSVMLSLVNDHISSTELTDFEIKKNSYRLWAGTFGSIGAMLLAYLSFSYIEVLIGIQCVGCSIMAIFDSKAYYALR